MSPVPSTPLIEHAAIERLLGIARRTDDRDFLASVVALFTEHTPPLLASLGTALRAGDRKTAGRIAHRIKGSSTSIGASAMAALCREIEAWSRGDDESDAPSTEAGALADRLGGTYDQTAAYFATYLEELATTWPKGREH